MENHLKNTKVNGTISNCCSSSVSFHNGFYKNETFKEPHYTCNKCNKITEITTKPMWTITDKGKYKTII